MAKGVLYDNFAADGRLPLKSRQSQWQTGYGLFQKSGPALAEVTATAEAERREPGLLTRHPFYPAHEPLYVCWEVLTPRKRIAGARWSLVIPCDGGGSSEAAPWQVWLEHPAADQFVWKVRTRKGEWTEKAIETSPVKKGFRMQLELKANELLVVINDRDAGTFQHSDYTSDPHFKFGSGYQGEAPAEVTSRFNWVEIGRQPLPKPRSTTTPASDLRGTDYFGYQISPAEHHSHGDIVELKDGRLLFVWTDYSGDKDIVEGQLSGKISKDRGRTWGDKFLVESDLADKGELHEPSLLRSRTSGDILLAWYVHADSSMHCQRSSNGGKTWSPSINISNYARDKDIRKIANNDCFLQLEDGRIMLACRAYISGVRHPFCMYSDDDGRTWRAGQRMEALPRLGAQGLNEPGVVELRDGRILMYGRTTAGRVYKTYSADRGETWGSAIPMPLPGMASPQKCRRIPATGDLLMIWNNDIDPGLSRPGVLRRTPLTAAISRDDGLTWEYVKNLDDDPFCFYCYHSLDFVDDRVLITYFNPSWIHTGGDMVKYMNIPLSWFYKDLGRLPLADEVTQRIPEGEVRIMVGPKVPVKDSNVVVRVRDADSRPDKTARASASLIGPSGSRDAAIPLKLNEASWWDPAWWGRAPLVNGDHKLTIEVTREGREPATVSYEFDVKTLGK